MQYYTVQLKRKVIKSFFEGKKMIREEVSFIEETYRDLPYSTAQAYKAKFPDAVTAILMQDGLVGRPVDLVVDGAAVERKTRNHQEDRVARRSTREEKPTSRGDSYADVINKMTGATA